jgi:hypothetical protein
MHAPFIVSRQPQWLIVRKPEPTGIAMDGSMCCMPNEVDAGADARSDVCYCMWFEFF